METDFANSVVGDGGVIMGLIDGNDYFSFSAVQSHQSGPENSTSSAMYSEKVAEEHRSWAKHSVGSAVSKDDYECALTGSVIMMASRYNCTICAL